MHKRSVFNVGQRVIGTMLTVLYPIGPGNSWVDIACQCDCGNTIVLSYQQVYYKKYSCGCANRPRANAIDYTGWQVTNLHGNGATGRTLSVLCRDTVDQSWVYMCHCCGEISKVPRGKERGLDRTLKDIAGKDCENYLPFVPIARLSEICALVGDNRVLGIQQKAEEIAVEYYLPQNVLRDSITNEIRGFHGFPKEPPGGFPRVVETMRQLREMAIKNRLVENPDGF